MVVGGSRTGSTGAVVVVVDGWVVGVVTLGSGAVVASGVVVVVVVGGADVVVVVDGAVVVVVVDGGWQSQVSTRTSKTTCHPVGAASSSTCRWNRTQGTWDSALASALDGLIRIDAEATARTSATAASALASTL